MVLFRWTTAKEVLPVDALMWSSVVLLFPATALRTMLYLFPGMRLEKVCSVFLPGMETSCIFLLSWSNNTRLYKSTFPEEGSHWTCKLVNVVFSLLISKWGGGKGSVKKKQTRKHKVVFLALGWSEVLHSSTKNLPKLSLYYHQAANALFFPFRL